MKRSSNRRSIILSLILLILVIVAYNTLMSSPEEQGEEVAADLAGSSRVEALLATVNGISFDRSVFSDPRFATLKSIETPLPSRPVGKQNPFGSN
jgi:hypothetical protein